MPSIPEILRQRAGQPGTALRFEDQSWTWPEYVGACAERADLLLSLRRPGPFHVGVLLDNVPEFSMWLGAAAATRAAVVGNPTRRGEELARDVRHTDCQLVVTETRHQPLLEGLDLGVGPERILTVDTPDWEERLAPHRGAALPDIEVPPETLYLLLFTSGTSGAPKAVMNSHRKVAFVGERISQMFQLAERDVCYLAMPMFHSNALFAGWSPAMNAGATAVLRRRFSASGFLPDVRRYGVTYFNYVGKPLSYILATPEQPDDAQNPLRLVFGNEAADHDIERFARRFGCPVTDSYGSTENGATVQRTPEMPRGALGRAPEGTLVLDPETGRECPPARFDEKGRLLNPLEAIGEIVNTAGAPLFEGYWKNEEANRQRMRDGGYWTGDLAYRDEKGFFYFAGRDFEWLRVDGENFAAAPLERILVRFPGVALAAVYAVPDPEVGDQVMAALQVAPGASFDAEGFAKFLAEQADLGTKAAPRFVRVTHALPITQTHKVLKRALRRERWECHEPVWWRPQKGGAYRRLEPADAKAIAEEFERRGRADVLARA